MRPRSLARRYGQQSRAGTKTVMPFVAEVDDVLIYPVLLVSDATDDPAFSITMGEQVSLAHRAFKFVNSSGTTILEEAPDGGPWTRATFPWKVYFSDADDPDHYASLTAPSGSGMPYIELPDGGDVGTRIRFYGGTGTPEIALSGVTVPTGSWFIGTPSASSLIAAAERDDLGTSVAVGTGTPLANTTELLDGTPLAGDLLVLIAGSTEATATATIGAQASIGADGTDGGVTASDGTRRMRIFSHVIQSGDISSGQVTCTLSAHGSGLQRRVAAFIFRNPAGWPTTGSRNGCPTVGTDTDTGIGSETTETLTVTGPDAPGVAVSATYEPSLPATPLTYRWDGGSTSNLSPESPDGTAGTSASSHPGLGTNTSNNVAYQYGGSSVVIANLDDNHACALAVWAPNPVAPFYWCSSGGTPGTWVAKP